MTNMLKWERELLFLIALLLIEHRIVSDLIALALFLPVLLRQLDLRRKNKGAKGPIQA